MPSAWAPGVAQAIGLLSGSISRPPEAGKSAGEGRGVLVAARGPGSVSNTSTR